MATDPAPALRAELLAAQTVVGSQVRGLSYLIATDPPVDLTAVLTSALDGRNRRYFLIHKVLTDLDLLLADLDALEVDGYPTLDPIQVADTALGELKTEVGDIEAGAAIFQEMMASMMEVTFGQPVPKGKTASP